MYTKTNNVFWVISLLISSTSFADIPNAGSFIREIEQNTPQIPQTLDSVESVSAAPTTKQTASNTDTTPIQVDNIVLKGRTLISQDKLQPLLDEYIGETTTFAGLQRLAQQISHVYQQAGYPLVTVVIPPQRIENGEVVLQVIEGIVSQLEVQNQSRVSDETVKRYVEWGIALNQPFVQSESERALLLLKDLAGTEQVSYQIGGNANGTNLTVNLEPAPLFDGYASVDNYGSDSTGEIRTRATVNLNSPLGYGERFSVSAMSSFRGIYNGSLSAEMPIGAQGTKLSADVSHTRYDLGGDFKDLDATGTSTTVNVGGSHPLIRSNKKNLWLNGGVRYSDLQDNIGATNTTTDKTVKAMQVGVSGNVHDNLLAGGYTQYGVNATLGNLSIDSADAKAIDAASAKTDGDFYKLSANISHTQYLNQQWSLYTALSGQIANKNLDSSEQISVGGVNGVAAYHPNDVSADQGVIGQIELRYRANEHLTLAGFYQEASVRLRHNPYTTGDNSYSLHGAGVGLYGNYNGFNLESKVAWRLGDTTFSNDKKPRFWIRASYGF